MRALNGVGHNAASSGNTAHFEPSTADFAHEWHAPVDAEPALLPHSLSTFTPPTTSDAPDSVDPMTYETATSAPPKRKRRRKGATSIPDVPALPLGAIAPDGLTRFDSRSRALSQRGPQRIQMSSSPSVRASGSESSSTASGLENTWGGINTPSPIPSPKPAKKRGWLFPEAFKSRRMPQMTKLTELDALFGEVGRYTEHFVRLLNIEQKEAEEQFNQRLADWPDDQLRREGFMLDGLSASIEWKPKSKVDGRVVTFTPTGKAAVKGLPPNLFTPGTTVLLSRTDPLRDLVKDPRTDQPLKGAVFSQATGHIRVAFPPLADFSKGVWRIDVGCSDFSTRRQLEAIMRLNLDPVQQDMGEFMRNGKKIAAPKAIEDEALLAARRPSSRVQPILVGTGLRDLLLRRFQTSYVPYAPGPNDRKGSSPKGSVSLPVDNIHDAVDMAPNDVDATLSPTPHWDERMPRGVLAKNKLIDSWTRRYRTPTGRAPLVVEGDPVIPLNQSQVRAIAMMLSERLSLVQGPPGTGKTRVIVETIKLLKQHWQVPHPILVCAHTNVAVDNLLDGLQRHGLKSLRFGTAARVPDHLSHLTYDAHAEQHPRWDELEALKAKRKDLIDVLESQPDLPESIKETMKKESAQLNRQLFVMRRQLSFDVLFDADVVVTTCLSATSRMLDEIDFPIVFLDEASMATEPLSLIPLTKGSSQVAIIGDHKQLPPVIVSDEAQAGGLSTSMFERLIHERQVPSIMLDTQYRMHPSISAFSSETFYNSQLKDGTLLPNGEVRPGLEPPRTAFLKMSPDGQTRNVTFLNHEYPESPQNRSLANHHEAQRVCDIVGDLLLQNPTLSGSDIGVIAPYAAQIRTIQEMLTLDSTRAAAFSAWLGPERAGEVQNIEVKTVDGFEGREKDVIVFSTVRSNSAGYIGFLADWRRLNVGITRAKRALIMLGSLRTLENARIGLHAAENLPMQGTSVWRRFVGWLRKEDLVVDDF